MSAMCEQKNSIFIVKVINEINKSFSGPAREQKLEIARQLELYNTMFDDNLTFGEYERAYVCPKKTNEYVEELE